VPPQLRHALQVGAHREDERLARQPDADDLARLGLRRHLVDRGVQIGQRPRPEGGGLLVVEAVVQRDQREAAAALRQLQVPHVRLRDHLPRILLRRLLQQLRDAVGLSRAHSVSSFATPPLRLSMLPPTLRRAALVVSLTCPRPPSSGSPR
jgi:hypothetical protein